MARSKRSRIKLPPAQYKKLCYDVMTRDGWRCTLCKRRESLHCHHVVFRSQGGDDVSSNLLTLCDTCHSAVHFVTKISGQGVIILPHDFFTQGIQIETLDYRQLNIDADKGVRFYYVNGWTPRCRK